MAITSLIKGKILMEVLRGRMEMIFLSGLLSRMVQFEEHQVYDQTDLSKVIDQVWQVPQNQHQKL